MRIYPYLTFNGDCRAAFEFYARCTGGKTTLMTLGESPMAAETPKENHDRILHATLTLGEQTISGADASPGNYHKPQGYSVTLELDSAAEADRIFTALAENGTIRMPIQKTFWAERFGMVVDRFGTPWMLNVSVPHQS